MFLAFTSFLSAGGADQSAMGVNSVGETEVVQNHTGPAGAKLAEFLINGCFGIPAYLGVSTPSRLPELFRAEADIS